MFFITTRMERCYISRRDLYCYRKDKVTTRNGDGVYWDNVCSPGDVGLYYGQASVNLFLYKHLSIQCICFISYPRTSIKASIRVSNVTVVRLQKRCTFRPSMQCIKYTTQKNAVRLRVSLYLWVCAPEMHPLDSYTP